VRNHTTATEEFVGIQCKLAIFFRANLRQREEVINACKSLVEEVCCQSFHCKHVSSAINTPRTIELLLLKNWNRSSIMCNWWQLAVVIYWWNIAKSFLIETPANAKSVKLSKQTAALCKHLQSMCPHYENRIVISDPGEGSLIWRGSTNVGQIQQYASKAIWTGITGLLSTPLVAQTIPISDGLFRSGGVDA
jgi:hypothetical protein